MGSVPELFALSGLLDFPKYPKLDFRGLELARPIRKAGSSMGNLGMQEIIVIFILALIVFGPRKLPELGKTLGKGLAEFKKASNELRQTWEDEVRLEKEKDAVQGILKDTSNEVTGILDDSSTGSKEIQ